MENAVFSRFLCKESKSGVSKIKLQTPYLFLTTKTVPNNRDFKTFFPILYTYVQRYQFFARPKSRNC